MALENHSSGGVYTPDPPAPLGNGVGATSVEMNDVSSDVNGTESKRKKKVIYFADGSTMEDYEDEDDSTDQAGRVEPMVRSSVANKLDSAPPADTSKMNWPEYVRYVSSKAGTKTLTVLEGMGGTAAYYLGITTPKYQSEIDEYNRMVAKKKSQEEELVSWSTGPKAEQKEPVVEDIKKVEGVEGEKIPIESEK